MASRIDGSNRFRDEHVDDRRLEFACDVGFARLGHCGRIAALCFAAHERQYCGLEARKTEVEIVRCQHRPRELDRAVASMRGEVGERGTARVAESQELR